MGTCEASQLNTSVRFYQPIYYYSLAKEGLNIKDQLSDIKGAVITALLFYCHFSVGLRNGQKYSVIGEVVVYN